MNRALLSYLIFQSAQYTQRFAVVLCIGISVVLAGCTASTAEHRSAAELYEEARTILVNEGNLAKARHLGQRAAYQDHVCAMAMMADLMQPRDIAYPSQKRKLRKIIRFFWKNERASPYWAMRFQNRLLALAQNKDPDAMLWLSRSYSNDWHLPAFRFVEKNDSIAFVWRERAIAAGSLAAKRDRAQYELAFMTNEEKNRALEEIALQGDAYAFWRWASLNIGNPDRYLRIVDLAISHEVSGVRHWAEDNILAFEQRVAGEGEEASQYKAMADSLNLSQRLAALPPSPPLQLTTFPMVCPW